MCESCIFWKRNRQVFVATNSASFLAEFLSTPFQNLPNFRNQTCRIWRFSVEFSGFRNSARNLPPPKWGHVRPIWAPYGPHEKLGRYPHTLIFLPFWPMWASYGPTEAHVAPYGPTWGHTGPIWGDVALIGPSRHQKASIRVGVRQHNQIKSGAEFEIEFTSSSASSDCRICR